MNIHTIWIQWTQSFWLCHWKWYGRFFFSILFLLAMHSHCNEKRFSLIVSSDLSAFYIQMQWANHYSYWRPSLLHMTHHKLWIATISTTSHIFSCFIFFAKLLCTNLAKYECGGLFIFPVAFSFANFAKSIWSVVCWLFLFLLFYFVAGNFHHLLAAFMDAVKCVRFYRFRPINFND